MSMSKTRFLDVIIETAKVFVPTDELTEEQLSNYDNIEYAFMFRRDAMGTAHYKLGRVAVNDRMIDHLMGKGPIIPSILLNLIQTTVHEIVHVLYPEYNEKQTKEKTTEWLNSYDWGSLLGALP